MSTDNLLRTLADLDPEFRRALLDALEDEPDQLRAYLRERGHADNGMDETGGDEDWTVITDEEPDTPKPSDLTPAEEALYSVVEALDTPCTAAEIRDLLNQDHDELVNQYSSLNNRGWVSNKLNTLAKEGLVGKFRDGREVRYTADIPDAVQRWALKNDIFEEDLSPDKHADRIVADTNMNRKAVRRAIQQLNK